MFEMAILPQTFWIILFVLTVVPLFVFLTIILKSFYSVTLPVTRLVYHHVPMILHSLYTVVWITLPQSTYQVFKRFGRVPSKAQHGEVDLNDLNLVNITAQLHLRTFKNLGITSSLETFSRYGVLDLEFYDYYHMANLHDHSKMACCPPLVLSLKTMGNLSRRVNDHLEELSVHGFNTFFFVALESRRPFKSLECGKRCNSHPTSEPLDSLKLVHSKLDTLSNSIRGALAVIENALVHQNQLSSVLKLTIDEVEDHQYNATPLQKMCFRLRLQSNPYQKSRSLLLQTQSKVNHHWISLERWRRELRLYLLNVSLVHDMLDSSADLRSFFLGELVKVMDRIFLASNPEIKDVAVEQLSHKLNS